MAAAIYTAGPLLGDWDGTTCCRFRAGRRHNLALHGNSARAITPYADYWPRRRAYRKYFGYFGFRRIGQSCSKKFRGRWYGSRSYRTWICNKSHNWWAAEFVWRNLAGNCYCHRDWWTGGFFFGSAATYL